jgi:hypothetical protein
VVNDLKQLLRDNVADAPADHVDVTSLVAAGRRRRRARRATFAGGTAALAVSAVVAALALGGATGSGAVDSADRPPAPDAPTLHLSDATRAVEGRDYRELASYTNRDLDSHDGQYFDGVTDDGLVLFRDGPRADLRSPRFALMDPATGEKDWLPDLTGVGQDQTWPVELSADRLVLLSLKDGLRGSLRAHVFDRAADRWSTVTWPDLRPVDSPRGAVGPDGRLYLLLPEDGAGDARHLWSVSLSDPTDVRDDGLRVGQVAFTDSSMVWTEASERGVGRIHIRDWATGDERVFDPHAGKRCHVLSLGATDDRVVIGEYCGAYAHGVHDNRVQILTTDGDQVNTVQGSEVSGWLPAGSDVVNLTVFDAQDDRGGTYVYDLETDRFLRVSATISSWGLGGTTANAHQFMWHTPVNDGHGDTQHLGELLP